ncbi:hypothetical protein B0H17DRAFT_1154548 [Mycena rosella]|uniref:Uncharacterized protein n=1 Tax=Mycena rosella TaxID=1033263 RepID=A0AAD7AYX8_MYCRO|nr:hypothetical protein B0H17DRAFT_1154548 [Mycena rosella]
MHAGSMDGPSEHSQAKDGYYPQVPGRIRTPGFPLCSAADTSLSKNTDGTLPDAIFLINGYRKKVDKDPPHARTGQIDSSVLFRWCGRRLAHDFAAQTRGFRNLGKKRKKKQWLWTMSPGGVPRVKHYAIHDAVRMPDRTSLSRRIRIDSATQVPGLLLCDQKSLTCASPAAASPTPGLADEDNWVNPLYQLSPIYIINSPPTQVRAALTLRDGTHWVISLQVIATPPMTIGFSIEVYEKKMRKWVLVVESVFPCSTAPTNTGSNFQRGYSQTPGLNNI